jgi:hypothetical protein
MPASRRRNLPMALMALFDNPMLLLKSPTPPAAGVDHFQTTNLRTIRMPSHKDTQQQITQESKAAYAECRCQSKKSQKCRLKKSHFCGEVAQAV